MCCFKRVLMLYLRSHWWHANGASPECMLRICCLSWSLRANDWSQSSHLANLTFSWTARTCLFILSALLNFLGQSEQVCWRSIWFNLICLIRILERANPFPHVGQTQFFAFWWTTTSCCFKPSWTENLLSHLVHGKGLFFSCTEEICLLNDWAFKNCLPHRLQL